MGKYQLNLSLQRLAAVQIVIVLLRKSPFNRLMKSKLCRWDEIRLVSRKNNAKTPPDLVSIEQVNAFICSKIEELVPGALRDDLRFVAESMQNHIYGWIRLLKTREVGAIIHAIRFVDYIFDDNMEHIQWTCIGTIDPTATIRSMYKSNLLAKDYDTFTMLSCYCVEDCVKELQPKVTRHVPDTIELSDRWMSIPLLMSFYWDRHLNDREDEVIAQLKQLSPQLRFYNYDESYSLNENLFIMSIIYAEYRALRYFWNLLDGDQKSRAMAKVAALFCQAYEEDHPAVSMYEVWWAKDIEVFVFLLQQLSFYSLKDMLIIMLRSRFLMPELFKWPWYSLVIEILEDIWKCHRKFDHTPIILRILLAFEDIKRMPNLRMDYRIIFRMIWDQDPFDMKKNLDYKHIINRAVDFGAVSGLKWIINDDELKESREKFINYALLNFKSTFEAYHVSLTVFVNDVLVTDEEREQFRSEVIAAWESRGLRERDPPPFQAWAYYPGLVDTVRDYIY